MFVLINDGILYGLSADLFMFAHADACKRTAAHAQMRVIFFLSLICYGHTEIERAPVSVTV